MFTALKLLAVDDDAASAELIVRVAERCGFEAFATSDPRGVINLVNALKPDLIAVDISMPHLDAVDLFKLLAQNNYAGRLIVVSGQDHTVLGLTARAAVALGLSEPAVHQKPLVFADLRATLLGMTQLARAS